MLPRERRCSYSPCTRGPWPDQVACLTLRARRPRARRNATPAGLFSSAWFSLCWSEFLTQAFRIRIMTIVLLVVVGLGIGVLSGMLGIGGGVLLVPILVGMFEYDQ